MSSAWETLTRYTKSEALLRHALAVEAAVGAYAQRFGEDEQLWRTTALLHDFDYEIHPTLDQHPQDGAQILRDEGWPEEVIDGVLSHASHLGLPRDTPLKKTLFACDELAGFVHACGLVRPDGIATLEPKSVKKKLKQPSFAAGVNRQDVYEGAEELGVELDDHIRFVVESMRPIAGELGLRTAERPARRRGDRGRPRSSTSRRRRGSSPGRGRRARPRRLVEPLDELGRVALDREADERALVRRGHDLEALGQQLTAARGSLGRPLVTPLGRRRRGRPRARPATAAASTPGRSAAPPGRALNSPSGS